ncbi:MAG: hypothetical protein Q9162_003429 [Coniocarpon cinnabarinum]
MRVNAVAALAVSHVLVTYAAPFRIQDGELQRQRRRAVDYPVKYANVPKPAHKLVARDPEPYSVVQVDGDSSSTAAPPAPPATMTVTPSPSTQTIVVTSVIPGPTSDETVLITTTQEVLDTTTSTAAGPTQVVTSHFEAPVALPQATVTAVSTSTSIASSIFTAQLSASDSDSESAVANTIMNTLVQTVTTTEATSTPTAYYDDGMWHTYYPIKNFVPGPGPSPTEAVSVDDTQASSSSESQSGLTNSSDAQPVQASTGSGRWKLNRRWEAPTPASNVEKWVVHPSASPTTYSKAWAVESRGVWTQYTPAPSLAMDRSGWSAPGSHEGAPYEPQASPAFGQSASGRQAFPNQPRRAPNDVKTANWIGTRRMYGISAGKGNDDNGHDGTDE